jgi:methionyl-tRNA synthetase
MTGMDPKNTPNQHTELSRLSMPLTLDLPEFRHTHFYISTPIYYPNSVPHIGHAYTTIVADILNRYNKLFGKKTFFVTGTDEHGQKVQQAAEKNGLPPQEHVDKVSAEFKDTWKQFSVEPSLFMRTTFNQHTAFVQHCLSKLYESGDIYKGSHAGWYSVSEEIFWPDKDIVDGLSPTGKEVVRIEEENYFFKMSRFKDRLIQHIEENPKFIQPDTKRSETLSFLKQDVNDLCIGRPKSRVEWGIELPFDDNFVTYVWFDALLNYVSALDVANLAGTDEAQELWDNATHLIGKDILITHSVYWPTMLMALEQQLPKTIFAHGWWLNSEGRKMSKSEGEVVAPLSMLDELGEDSFRYYMSRGVRLGNDLAFDLERAKAKLNGELANNYGNLISRTVKLSAKTFGNVTPTPALRTEASRQLAQTALQTSLRVVELIEDLDVDGAVGAVVKLMDETNRYFGDHMPWKLAKESKTEEVAEVLYTSLESIRIASVLLSPVMPKTTRKVLKMLCPHRANVTLKDALEWGVTQGGIPLDPQFRPLFEKY